MNNKRQILSAIIAVLISVGLVATAVYATTTIGNDVSVGGDLDIVGTDLQATTGTLNISKSGSMTTILGAFTVTATTTLNGTLVMGTSGSPFTLAAEANRAIDIYTTSALTTGSIKSVEIAQVHTVANTASNIEVLKVQLTSDVKTGEWVNAIFGRLNYTANGYAYGSGSAIAGELSMPAGGPGQGTYSVFQAEIDIPTGATAIGYETSVFDINVWGGKKDLFDDSGFLFSISGVTSGANDFFYDSTSGVVDGFLKVRINGTTYYLLLADDQS